ncbi:MAG: regulatory iron-sulfur-containing complex subunit RicT, partial [Candidatus Fermentibacteria bacterium]|nr:regulatory iron-sulfur-containing complex subunit RicT [Candidatus Fermentibacteria bacterium]
MVTEDALNMESQPIEILQLAFKSRRLLMFANRTRKPVDMGDMVVVSVDRGEDMGRVVAKLPLSEVNADRIEGSFLRLSTDVDMEKFKSNREFEKQVLLHCETRIKVRNLDMFLSDCESQLDRNRIRIFFTADQRTDFRGLVRDMASAFRARIEMRQIGVRDDAKYKDGVGICGRQL